VGQVKKLDAAIALERLDVSVRSCVEPRMFQFASMHSCTQEPPIIKTYLGNVPTTVGTDPVVREQQFAQRRICAQGSCCKHCLCQYSTVTKTPIGLLLETLITQFHRTPKSGTSRSGHLSFGWLVYGPTQQRSSQAIDLIVGKIQLYEDVIDRQGAREVAERVSTSLGN
jgi:hypothetical protein